MTPGQPSLELDELAPTPPPLRRTIVFPLLNSIFTLAVLGTLLYTRILYKRPSITESSERERLIALLAKPLPPVIPALVAFESITSNIESFPSAPLAAPGTWKQIQGKLHYATVSFSLEIRDESQKDLIETLRPFILDQLMAILGKKRFHELTHIQGRYLLKSQLIEMINHLISSRLNNPSKESLVTNLYFTQFITQ